MYFKFNSVGNNNYFKLLKENGFKVLRDISDYKLSYGGIVIELNNMKDMVKLYGVIGYSLVVNDEEILVYDDYME